MYESKILVYDVLFVRGRFVVNPRVTKPRYGSIKKKIRGARILVVNAIYNDMFVISVEFLPSFPQMISVSQFPDYRSIYRITLGIRRRQCGTVPLPFWSCVVGFVIGFVVCFVIGFVVGFW